MTSILIVVLNWNGLDDTKECVDSLLALNYKNYKILIVDNGSKDNSAEELRKIAENNSSKVSFIANTKNLGFAGGVNTGISYVIQNNYDAVALINNDATVDSYWLSNLEKNLKGDTAIVTGLLLRTNGKTIDSSGDFYSSWGIGFPRGRGKKTADAPTFGPVFGATGGASLYKTSLFKEIGLFDETFFAYYEDVDISFRAQLAGYKVYYTKDAIAYHKQGATSKKIPGFTVYQTFKNIPLLFWKNVPTRLLLKIGLRFTLLYVLILGNAIKNGSGAPAIKGVLVSIWYFWTSALWKRLKIQSRKKVDAKYIWSIIHQDLPPEQTGVRKFRNFFIMKP